MNNLAYEETLSCVQCGYCLPACPTYIAFKKETHSPRGRINLVKMAAEGRITFDDMKDAIDLCLGCRACETACPSNVEYGKILESAVNTLAKHKDKKMKRRMKVIKNMLLGKMIPSKRAQNILSSGLALYQKTGLQKLAHSTKVLNILPENLREFEQVLPVVEGSVTRNRRQSYYSAVGEASYKVGFFTGCMMDTMFSAINTQSIRLLQQAGCNVTIIKEQGCCGALQQHSGDAELTSLLARHNISTFEQHNFDYIVNSIGGCGAMLIEYESLFTDDSEWTERAKAFSQKVIDISALLLKLSLPFSKVLSYSVTYQPSCHMTNVQKCISEPIELLKKIPGIRFIPLPDANMCCGSAGIYNIVKYESSMHILNNKMENVKSLTELPAIIVTTNPGCHLQMKLGIKREGLTDSMRAVHLVELLAEACDLKI